MDIKEYLKVLDSESLYRERMYKRYTAERIPIKTETLPKYLQADVDKKTKADRRLVNHFEGEIVNTKTGYFAGNPVIITSYDQEDTLNDFLDEFNISFNYEDLFSEITSDAAASGVAGVLLYKDEDADIRVFKLNPAEFAVFRHLGDPVAAVRRYSKNGKVYVEQFDKESVMRYEIIKGEPVLQGEPEMHGFRRVPIVEVMNNRNKQADYHTAVDSIDAYNRLISDFSNEIESFRLAYMILRNMSADEKDLKALRETGAIHVDDDGEVSFLTKKLDVAAVDKMREILEKNIARFSGHVVMSSTDFTGNLTRIAVQTKLTPLEQKAHTFQLKFTSFLREFYRTVFSYKGLSQSFDHTNLTFKYTRNIPRNVVEDVDIFVKLDGKISDETRLSMLPFIDNPLDEKEKMEREGGTEQPPDRTVVDEQT